MECDTLDSEIGPFSKGNCAFFVFSFFFNITRFVFLKKNILDVACRRGLCHFGIWMLPRMD